MSDRKKMRRPAVVLGVLVGVGAVAAFAVRGRTSPPKNVTTAHVPAPSPTPVDPPGPRTAGCAIAPGTELAYRVSVHATGTMHGAALGLQGAASAGDSRIEKAVDATLALRALSSDASGSVVLARFRDLQDDALVGESDAPFLLRIDSRCKIGAFARLKSTGLATARTIQGLAYELQWKWPEGESVEEDGESALGRFRARHTVGTDGSVVRTIAKFTTLWSNGADHFASRDGDDADEPNGPSPRVPSMSTLTVEPGKGAWFESLGGTLALRDVSAVDTETVTKANRTAFPNGALEGASPDVAKYVWEDLLPKRVTLRTKREVTRAEMNQREKVREVSLDQSVDGFVKRVASGVGFAESWPPLTT
jgi:hypothetical protein